MEVLVTVTRSVRVVDAPLLPLPRNNATSIKIKTTAPATQIQGELYQSAGELTVTDLVVVVEPDWDEALS